MSTLQEILENTPSKLADYKIPLKTTDAVTKVDLKTEGDEKPDNKMLKTEVAELFQTPLINVEPDILNTMRFNYTYQHSVTITPTINFDGNRICSTFPPPPPPPPLPEEEFIKRYPYLNSSTFPEPLKKLLQPLACQLCHVRLNSRISGQMHYDSKNHSKKVHIWLQEWAKETGEPAPKRVKVMKEALPAGPNAYHCDPCNIALTSVQHAEQHYSGKKHRAVVMGLATTPGSGFYDANRKWIRTQPELAAPIMHFYEPILTDTAVNKSPIKTKTAVATTNSTDPSIFCNICNIHVSRESQMKAHLEGAKHAKILRALQAPPYVAPHDTLLTSVTVVPIKEAPVISQPKLDISIYRTPSGSFYCQLCDITLETEHLFNQHLNCKKHIRKQNTNGKD